MTYLQDKINTFYKKGNKIFQKPLEKIINNMLRKCEYINGTSLESHNWGKNPIKLKKIPKDINSETFEVDLLNALDLEDNEKPEIELLWGDIQLGKRVHACIIMWISVYILKRPVLYIFRNLRIDQTQLQDDITGSENYNFNIQYIKTIMDEFNNELQEHCEEKSQEYYKDYKLPDMKDIKNNDIIRKLSNKEAINSNDIFCCLMNNAQLTKLNDKFDEYISLNDELVNITTLVDESDLTCPTSSNDRTNVNDVKDSTECEKLIAKIFKKVKYALHITGTAHSLLYNVTTTLSKDTAIQIKISKVHKMKRSNDYFGLFNNSIKFNTTLVKSWWEYRDTENLKKKTRYDTSEDYKVNIKKIIEEILKRPTTIKYNSLLISEERLRDKQFCLVDKIIQDFPNLFIIIYHGNCLRLYFSKIYEQEIRTCSQWDSEQTSTNQRLYQDGGVYKSPLDGEKSEKLPNNYCYFEIDTKILNIKFLYKLLRILFEKSKKEILCRTIITITGKYGERGYSFTSDDYDNYSLHLTDQYFVSHASKNCTDISQRIRLQGKYNDLELKNGSMKLTLWTTPEIQDITMNFYVPWIKEIENKIPDCNSPEEIIILLENVIDNGDLKFGKYMKYIDVSKKRKNLKETKKKIDTKLNGYPLIIIDEMNDSEISEWCKKKKNLPEYRCINEIKEMNIYEFIDKHGSWEYTLDEQTEEFNTEKEYLNYIEKNNLSKAKNYNKNKSGSFYKTSVAKDTKIYTYSLLKDEIKNLNKGSNLGITYSGHGENIGNIKTRLYISYKDIKNPDSIVFTLRICKVTEKKKILPKQTYDYIKKIPYSAGSDIVKYSVLKEEYKQNNNTQGNTNDDVDDFIEDNNTVPEKYYFKTTDGWLYLYDKDKPKIISIEIVEPLPIKNVIQTNISTEPLINSDMLLFANSCCKKTEKTNLRFGLKDIYKIYEIWCKKNGKKCLKTQKKFKEEFEKINYKEEKSKGVDVNNKSG